MKGLYELAREFQDSFRMKALRLGSHGEQTYPKIIYAPRYHIGITFDAFEVSASAHRQSDGRYEIVVDKTRQHGVKIPGHTPDRTTVENGEAAVRWLANWHALRQQAPETKIQINTQSSPLQLNYGDNTQIKASIPRGVSYQRVAKEFGLDLTSPITNTGPATNRPIPRGPSS